jgi:hypothetical protein
MIVKLDRYCDNRLPTLTRKTFLFKRGYETEALNGLFLLYFTFLADYAPTSHFSESASYDTLVRAGIYIDGILVLRARHATECASMTLPQCLQSFTGKEHWHHSFHLLLRGLL